MTKPSMITRLSAISLLWDKPGSDQPAKLDQQVTQDLRIEPLLDSITSDNGVAREIESMLAARETDTHTIERRQAVISDFVRNPSLREATVELQQLVAEIQTSGEREWDRDLLRLVWRLGDLILMVDAIKALRSALEGCGDQLQSDAMRELAAILSEADRDAQFSRLSHELPRLREGLRERRSVTVGVNLDDRLRPREAVLLSVNQQSYTGRGLLGSVGEALFGEEKQYRAKARIHTNKPSADWTAASSRNRAKAADDPTRIPLAPLFQDLDELLTDVSRPLARALKRYNAVQLSWLLRLVGELAVCRALADMWRRLQEQNLPVSTAVRAEGSEFTAEGLYEPLLALERASESPIVTNDVSLFGEEPITVVTGPNNGGKTTLVRAVGVAHLFGAAGLPVGARRARVPECIRVVSEFVGGESDRLTEGRFAHEAKRVAEILDSCDPHTLVLLNETFSSTGAVDAVSLLEEVLTVIARRGGRAVVATHLHALPEQITSDSLTIRPQNLYQVVRGLPDGKSLAREVAKEVGLDLDRYSAG